MGSLDVLLARCRLANGRMRRSTISRLVRPTGWSTDKRSRTRRQTDRQADSTTDAVYSSPHSTMQVAKSRLLAARRQQRHLSDGEKRRPIATAASWQKTLAPWQQLNRSPSISGGGCGSCVGPPATTEYGGRNSIIPTSRGSCVQGLVTAPASLPVMAPRSRR